MGIKLVCNGCAQCANWPNKLNWAGIAESGRFSVYRENGSIVSAEWGESIVRVYFSDNTPDRIIPATDIVPVVRLYLNAQIRRKTLTEAPIMFIRDV